MPADPRIAKFSTLSTFQFGKTLAQKLIPTVDGIRNLSTKFGIRPYTLKVVRVRWTGSQRYEGTPTVVDEMPILPTPLIVDLSTMQEVNTPVGLDEVGTILVTEISGAYTDEQLRFQSRAGDGPEIQLEVFYEIEFRQPNGSPGDKRRFFIRSAPQYWAAKCMWQIRLERQRPDRNANGDPNG